MCSPCDSAWATADAKLLPLPLLTAEAMAVAVACCRRRCGLLRSAEGQAGGREAVG